MSTTQLIRVDDEFDPDRCQATGRNSQCPYKAMSGVEYCARHGGKAQLKREADERYRMYHLERWKKRVDELAGTPEIKDLHEEVGIVRMILEEIVNQCQDAQDLLRHSSKIIQAVDKIEKLITTLDRIDSRQNLEPAVLAQLAAQWVQIITVHVTDPHVLEKLSQELTETLDTKALTVEA